MDVKSWITGPLIDPVDITVFQSSLLCEPGPCAEYMWGASASVVGGPRAMCMCMMSQLIEKSGAWRMLVWPGSSFSFFLFLFLCLLISGQRVRWAVGSGSRSSDNASGGWYTLPFLKSRNRTNTCTACKGKGKDAAYSFCVLILRISL